MWECWARIHINQTVPSIWALLPLTLFMFYRWQTEVDDAPQLFQYLGHCEIRLVNQIRMTCIQYLWSSVCSECVWRLYGLAKILIWQLMQPIWQAVSSQMLFCWFSQSSRAQRPPTSTDERVMYATNHVNINIPPSHVTRFIFTMIVFSCIDA